MTRVADDIPDTDLVAAAKEGDRQAFSRLVERHLKAVYNVAARILSRREEAEDVAQDAFLRAYERLDQYSTEFPFRNWLLKIATNLAINRLRSRRRENDMTDGLTLRLSRATSKTASPSPDQWLAWLERLDDPLRTAIVLFHFQEMSYEQIADVMDTPLNTVRTYLHRGRKRLREIIRQASTQENGQWTVAM